MNKAIQPLVVALVWVPTLTFFCSLYGRSDAFLYTLVGATTFVGLAFLSRLRCALVVKASAMGLYAVTMPFFLLFCIVLLGVANGSIPLGH